MTATTEDILFYLWAIQAVIFSLVVAYYLSTD